MAEETFVALRQFHLGPERIVKVGEEFKGETRDIREHGILCGKFPLAVRPGDERIPEAIRAQKSKMKKRAQAAQGGISALLARLEKLEARLGKGAEG